MILSARIIRKIEGLLEKGFTIELRHEEGDMIPTRDGPKPRPPQVTVFKRPDDPDDILCPPTLINQGEKIELELRAIITGEDPIQISKVVVPAGWHFAGYKGYRKSIS